MTKIWGADGSFQGSIGPTPEGSGGGGCGCGLSTIVFILVGLVLMGGGFEGLGQVIFMIGAIPIAIAIVLFVLGNM